MTDDTKTTKDEEAKYNQCVRNEQMSSITKVTEKTNFFCVSLIFIFLDVYTKSDN